MSFCSCGAEYDDETNFCGSCGVPVKARGSDSSQEYTVAEVFGSYRLVQQIGQGGMGRVFIAEHTRLERRVALKMLRSEFSDNAEAVKRFFSEARAVNRIKHENIIEITDFVENAQGHSFYIMELLEGVDLRKLRLAQGALPIGRAVRIAIQVCRGLGAAHQAGIVHRDLKPDNIFLIDRPDRKDFVKLLDFGVAKLMDDGVDSISTYRTTAGLVVGTPEYMSPEQASGGPADRRSDIYALGVILFEMITGQRPFDAPSAREVMAQHVTVAPPRPSKILRFGQTIPSALEDLILACLKKAPEDRPQTVQEVEHRLDEIARRLSVSVSSAERVRSRWNDRRWRIGVAAMALGLVVAGVFARAERRNRRDVGGATSAGAITTGVQTQTATAAAAATPATIEVAFDSVPPGATVLRSRDNKPLGTTPFSARFVPSPAQEVFEFSKPGWRSRRKELSLVSSTDLAISLEPLEPEPALEASERSAPRAVAARPSRPANHAAKEVQKLDHSAVLDPFE
jgi:serine/threonine-protein kinase